ncbi:hypothetical protein OUZ56_022423 [Daphnia magna]|uniref:Uncharacterized protein n=1 Tax=Daphnia magna TaxID=35525 RepID=A0ABR0AWC1_9CRUS|nr:hypothetical protein OUZ56_022423 [Daphnia magna]
MFFTLSVCYLCGSREKERRGPEKPKRVTMCRFSSDSHIHTKLTLGHSAQENDSRNKNKRDA